MVDVQVIGIGIAMGGAVAGVGLYVIRAEMRGDITRLDGRMDLHSRLHEELREDVTYIRDRIDRALNGRGK